MIARKSADALSPIDLHCHSERSDGCLTPQALVARAASRGVCVLGLTDHDTVEGLDAAHAAARAHGVALVPGVEVSVTWSGRTLHVVGLNVDPGNVALETGLRGNREGRLRRAESIAQRLSSLGIGGALAGALEHAANPENVSRTHFARHLVAAGVVNDMKAAFRRFLGEGKPGYARHCWASLAEAVQWIRGAGGDAVLAHPMRYGLRAPRLRALMQEFHSCGGAAIEVTTAAQQAEHSMQLAKLAVACGLAASTGSDFHGEDSWLDLGAFPALPSCCEPVWRRWDLGGSTDICATGKHCPQ